MRRLTLLPLLIGLLFLTGCGWWTRIDPGEAGALLTYSENNQGQAKIEQITPGHWVFVDWVTQKLARQPIGQQTLTMVRAVREGKVQGDDSISCQDINLVGVHIDVSVMWRIDPAHVGEQYLRRPTANVEELSDQVVRRDARSAVPIACGQFTYEEIKASRRADFGNRIKETLQPVLGESFILLDQIAVGETYIDSKDIDASISAKAKAQIDAQAATALLQKTQNEQAAKLAEAQAQQQIRGIQAKTDAEANQEVAQSITPDLIRLETIKKWDGHLPQVEGGATPLVNLAPQPTPVH